MATHRHRTFWRMEKGSGIGVLTVGFRTTRQTRWRVVALRDGLLHRRLLAEVGAGGGRSVSTTDAWIWRTKTRQSLSRRESKERGEFWGARERRGSPELAGGLDSYRRLRRNGGVQIGQPGGGVLGFRGWERRGEGGLKRGTDAGAINGLNGRRRDHRSSSLRRD